MDTGEPAEEVASNCNFDTLSCKASQSGAHRILHDEILINACKTLKTKLSALGTVECSTAAYNQYKADFILSTGSPDIKPRAKRTL